MTDHPTPEHIMQVGLGFWASKTLLSAIEVGLFTELARHPEDLESLRERLGLHERSARDFLDALVALGFLERRDGIYNNTPSTDLFLDKRKPSYLGGLLEMANARLYGFWGGLTDGAAHRTAPERGEVRRHPVLRGPLRRPRAARQFLAAMTGLEPSARTCGSPSTFLGRPRELRRRGHGPGRPRGADRPRAPPPLGHRLRPARGAPVFEEYVAQHGLGVA